MKRKLLLLASLMTLGGAITAYPVYAEPNATIKEGMKKIDAYEFEGDNGITYIFSNPREEDGKLLLDLDYTNNSDDSATLWTDLAFDISFEQEDDVEVRALFLDIYDTTEEINGRKPVTHATKIKAGAEDVKLYLALEEFDPSEDLFIKGTPLLMGFDNDLRLEVTDIKE